MYQVHRYGRHSLVVMKIMKSPPSRPYDVISGDKGWGNFTHGTGRSVLTVEMVMLYLKTSKTSIL